MPKGWLPVFRFSGRDSRWRATAGCDADGCRDNLQWALCWRPPLSRRRKSRRDRGYGTVDARTV